MLNAKMVFQKNIQQANELGVLYSNLSDLVPLPEQFDDLLRSQLVYAVSAFDKLLHDLIRIGMVQIFLGTRPSTSKYENERIPIRHLPQLVTGSTPPPEVRFEEIVREKFSILSFQQPKKIADGLSFIWDEQQKWQQIALGLGTTEEDARRNQNLIAIRRNAIVHESDLNPLTNAKQPITRAEATQSSDFLSALGLRICDLII